MYVLFAALLVSASAPSPSAAPVPLRADWELLGSRRVSFAAEKDVITARHEGRFRAIKLEVQGGNLDMYNIRVVFGDGETFSPETRVEFREGSWSRTIDLPGAARVIRRIEFWYRSELKRGRAVVRVYGMQGDGDDHGHGPGGGNPLEGWNRLGERQVSFRAERDVISALGEGRFRRIMLVVKDADLEMFDVRVIFGDGEPFSPATRLYFGGDTRSRVIDLPGDARIIRRIEFAYKSVRGGGDGRATIEVYGR
jgi:hypothetical protein